MGVEVNQLTVNYDKTPVLWNIHFSTPKGKLVGVIGPNGAGKSTLLKAILGMIKPICGTITLFGKPLKQVRKKIAYVPQRNSVDWDFPITAIELVLMGCYSKRFRFVTKKQKKEAYLALEKVGMAEFATRQIGKLSGGQQQRIFIARAIVQDADLYFMDEPFAGVDATTESAMFDLILSMQKKGKTFYIVHHDLQTVEKYFDFVVMLNTCLVGSGPTSEMLNEENIKRTYGKSSLLLDEVAKLSFDKSKGLA